MPSGLVALLDDVAAIAKLAAASLDEIGAAASKAGTKAAGVVIDDTAVTPRYVTGLSPDRELPIIAKIARGSLKNKLIILLPAAMLLSAFAPWAVTPLLMLGGAYLCFEATEKIAEKIVGHQIDDEDDQALTAQALEDKQVAGAVRTDLILSAEIMAIALADLTDRPLITQGVVLALVGIAITVGVYGAVAIIVKMDDVGLNLAKRDPALLQALGRLLVRGMLWLLSALSTIGTAAMLWVGGGIIVHGLEEFGFAQVPHLIHDAGASAAALPAVGAIAQWLVGALAAAVVGIVVGGLVLAGHHVWHAARHRHQANA